MSLTERLKLGSELKSTVSINRQVVPKIYDTFSKEVTPNRVIAKVFKNTI